MSPDNTLVNGVVSCGAEARPCMPVIPAEGERKRGGSRCAWAAFILACLVVTTGVCRAQEQPAAGGQPAQQKPAVQQPPQEAKEAELGRVIVLPGLTDARSREIYEMLVRKALFELNYEVEEGAETALTRGLDEYECLSKQVSADEKRSLIIGLKMYATQDNQIVLRGSVTKGGVDRQVSPEVTLIEAEIKKAIKATAGAKRKYTPRELELEFYQLSHIHPKECLQILGALGYNTSSPPKQLTLEQLPIIFSAPDSSLGNVVGGDKLSGPTGSGIQNRLIMLYHPSQGEQMVKLQRLLEEKVDVPARSVLIEAMVIELTEKALKELGVEWEWENRVGEVWGSFKAEGGVVPMRLFFDDFKGKTSDVLKAQLRALIEEREAEVLSCPSVLTLDNSQARITIGQEVPVFKTIITEWTSGAKVDVQYKKVGITLNIKPRISRDGTTVTMQIQAEVSEAPLADYLEIEGEKVAPLVSTRKVETIAQVNNDTPFIIGGLIRNEAGMETDRIPILSKVPILGVLFQVKSDTTEKREVIIVLTPRVLEPQGPNRPILPKDSARFDFIDNRLFRNSYRLKADDVFDLDFVREDQHIINTFRRARELVKEEPRYAAIPPFDALAAGRLPGEEAIVIRMLYEVVHDKLKLHERLEPGHLIYFQKNPGKPAGFSVRFLERTLKKESPDGTMASFLGDRDNKKRKYPKKVLILRYGMEPGSKLARATKAPVAEVEVRVFNSRDEVEEAWYEENRLQGYERRRTAIFLDSPKDLERLKSAVMVREIVSTNEAILNLDNFRVGRRIAIPAIREKNERIFLIDHTVSEYHYLSEFYYAAFQNKLRTYYEGIQRVLGNK